MNDAEMSDLEKARLVAREYQVVLDGKTINAAELTHSQALVALLRAIETIEAIGEDLNNVDTVFSNWQNHGYPR